MLAVLPLTDAAAKATMAAVLGEEDPPEVVETVPVLGRVRLRVL